MISWSLARRTKARSCAALMAAILSISCGKGSPTSPSATLSSSNTGASALTIRVIGNNGPATGAITLFGPAPATNQIATVAITNEVATFSALKPGDYQFNVVPTSFGDATRENNLISVSGVTTNTQIALDRKWDIRFIDVSVAGRQLAQGEVVDVPTTLRFHYQIMNPEPAARLTLAIQAEIGFDRIIGSGTSATVGPNLQDVTLDLANFRPCNDVAGKCFGKSYLFLATVGPPESPFKVQRNTDFSLLYPPMEYIPARTTIGGTIRDAQSGRPIVGVAVRVLAPAADAGIVNTSASDGSYRLEGISSTTFTVEFSHPSYQAVRTDYTLMLGTTRLDLSRSMTPIGR